jgi:hypothetical protein
MAQGEIHPLHSQVEFTRLIMHDNKLVDTMTFFGPFRGFFGIGI